MTVCVKLNLCSCVYNNVRKEKLLLLCKYFKTFWQSYPSLLLLWHICDFLTYDRCFDLF